MYKYATTWKSEKMAKAGFDYGQFVGECLAWFVFGFAVIVLITM